eukprot:UN06740
MKRDVAYLKQQVESNNGNEELLSALEGQVRKKADEVKKTEEELERAREQMLDILVKIDETQDWRKEVDASIKRADNNARKLAKEIKAAGALLEESNFDLPWWRKYFWG